MSSIRTLKKDIHFLTTEIITEGYVKQLLHEETDKTKLSEIMVEAIRFRDEFIARVNHPDGKDNPKLIKVYYQTVRKDMLAKYLEMSEAIEKL
jgi:hypothetical protein